MGRKGEGGEQKRGAKRGEKGRGVGEEKEEKSGQRDMGKERKGRKF